MAETTPLSGQLTGASGRELRQLQQFLLYFGSALTAAREAVNEIEEHLRRVAAAYGAPSARVSVLPTYAARSAGSCWCCTPRGSASTWATRPWAAT